MSQRRVRRLPLCPSLRAAPATAPCTNRPTPLRDGGKNERWLRPVLDRHQSALRRTRACLRPSLAIPHFSSPSPKKFTPPPENNTMPSFTTAAKDEILSNKAVRQHFPNQQSFGLMVFSREFSVPKMQMLTRERRAAQYYSQLVQSVRPMTGTVTLREEKLSTGQLAYRVTVDDMADRIDLYNHFAMLYPEGVTFELLGGDEGAGAFVGGVFLACGTLSDPEVKYHLEFAIPREELLMMFVALLQDVGFSPLLTQRRGQAIVYLHDSTQIEDLLTFMGCPLTSMEIMNAKILKERRNAANRVSNCDTANMDKVAGAAAGQIAAINAVGLDSLPEELRALAELRLQNPFDSLRELGQKLTPPLSRSGVNHRLEKIIDLAARKD